MVLHRHLGELLEGRAVLTGVLHAGFGENRRHGPGPEQPFLRDPAAAASATQEPSAHLFDADGQHDVVQVRLDRRPGFPERRRASRAGVGHVDHGNAGLADLLQDTLPDHAAGLAEIAAVQGLHVLDGQPAVVERHERRLRTELGDGFLRKPSELDHVHTDYVRVCHVGCS